MGKSNTATVFDLNEAMKACEIHGRSKPLLGTGKIVKAQSATDVLGEAGFDVSNFKFSLFSSDRSRTHIAIDGDPICGERGLGTMVNGGMIYHFDGESCVNEYGGMTSITHLVDCRKCLRWFEKHIEQS